MNSRTCRSGTPSDALRAAGFTLIETLVAMVVISVGMLGIAALYVEGLRAGRTSIYRTAAVDLAADMADRIRANPSATVAYAGAGSGANNCVGGPGDCTPVQLAADDIFWWEQSVQTLLPGGDYDIAVVAGANNSAYTITVTWTEPGVAQPLDYTLSVQL